MGRGDGLGTGKGVGGDSPFSPAWRGALALGRGPGNISLEVASLIVNALWNWMFIIIVVVVVFFSFLFYRAAWNP